MVLSGGGAGVCEATRLPPKQSVQRRGVVVVFDAVWVQTWNFACIEVIKLRFSSDKILTEFLHIARHVLNNNQEQDNNV